MDLYDVMRTTAAVRDFTEQDVSDEQLYNIIENARFAPSGGNRQGAKIIIVRDTADRERIAELTLPAAKRYLGQIMVGESPWNPVYPTSLSEQDIADGPDASSLVQSYLAAPVVLLVCLDLQVIAATDMNLDRIGVVPGASVYPLVWNIMLAARNEGLGGVITTMPIAAEEELKSHFGIPDTHAICAAIPLGRPVKQLTKLKRVAVEEFCVLGRFNGESLSAG